MKRFLPFLNIAFVFAACTSGPTETEIKTVQSANQAKTVDTAGLAQFQQWKTQNELSSAAVPAQQPAPQEAAVEQVKTVAVIRERIVERPAPVRRQATPKPQPVSQPKDNQIETNTGAGEETAGNTGTGTSTTEPAVIPEPAKKEGWSKAAKGAAIGGAGGAVIGAIIGKKNPAVGAAIGGVLGGAVGYGIGKKQDTKDGRN
jgi:hypothetical protein